MQKKLTAITLALLLILSITASALPIQPRWNVTASCEPVLTFSGTTATCVADVRADSGASISGTMTLYRVSSVNQVIVASWNFSGNSDVFAKKSTSVTKGQTYKLVVSVTVTGSDGTDRITLDTTKTC